MEPILGTCIVVLVVAAVEQAEVIGIASDEFLGGSDRRKAKAK
jgi:hypothetical protein